MLYCLRSLLYYFPRGFHSTPWKSYYDIMSCLDFSRERDYNLQTKMVNLTWCRYIDMRTSPFIFHQALSVDEESKDFVLSYIDLTA